jgi:hypothetical protein
MRRVVVRVLLALSLVTGVVVSVVASSAAGAAPADAQASRCRTTRNVVHNGGFEAGHVPPGNPLPIPPWVVNGVDPSNDWPGQTGQWSVDLNGGSAPGNIHQTLATIKNHTYILCFWLAGNPDGGPTVKQMTMRWDNLAAVPYAFSIAGKSRANMGWVLRVRAVVSGNTGSDTLTFTGVNLGAFGAVIDTVSVR